MKKMSFLFIVLFFQVEQIDGQSPHVDKNIVMDLFQNMKYEDAISYLLPAEKMDSSNMQILGYLGYAYHMNDDLSNAGKYYQKMLDVDSTNVSEKKYYSRYMVLAKMQSVDEKKAYDYIRKKYFKK